MGDHGDKQKAEDEGVGAGDEARSWADVDRRAAAADDHDDHDRGHDRDQRP